VLVQPGGKVVIAGHIASTTGTSSDFLLARLDARGRLDTTFGDAGAGFTFTNFDGRADTASSIITNYDGNRLIVGGSSDGRFALAQYTLDGVPDAGFGTDGKIRTDLGAGARALARGPGRRFVAAGSTQVSKGKSVFRAVRFLDDGANVVSVSPLFNDKAYEQGQRPATVFVYRNERLPYATRVYLTKTGTATGQTFSLWGEPNPTDFHGWADLYLYTPYVDIPAGQALATIEIAPVDDDRVEGNETVIFSIVPHASYDIGVNNATFTIVDNDAVSLASTADAFVRDGAFANTNFGAAEQLQVKNSAGDHRRIDLRFDLSSVSTINSAKLRLFGSLSGAGSQAFQVFSTGNSSWTEFGITFNNKPTVGATALASTTMSGTFARAYEWDLTAFLRAEKAAGRNVVTLAVRTSTVSPLIATFNSGESAGNWPELVIT
jgi:hypothetical protein